jgi:uncharacterized protein (DUF934 family)
MLLDDRGATVEPISGAVLEIEDTVDPRSLAEAVASAQVIALSFPVYRNGRAFSQAAVLRKLMGYTGLLVARGAVLVDQVRLMREAGFNRFDVDDTRAEAIAVMLTRPDPARWRDTAVAQ